MQLARVKEALIKVIGEQGHDVSSMVVFAALVDLTIDAGIIMGGREKAAEAISNAVNIRLLNSSAQQVDP